ncbi:YvrJ family protein [Salirhabdus sp. Marseille-P4669]|nr:YvrJ family protein [Salirhabdus sp. Marseille-P4669]
MEQWVNWIPEIGFPIVVTFYLLHRIEGKLDVLIESIIALPDKMDKQ